MKKIIIALAMLATTPLAAAPADECVLISQIAERIMELRQENVPITEVLAMTSSPEVIRDMAILAYKQPLQKLQSDKQRAIVDFGAVFYITCTEIEFEDEGIPVKFTVK